MVESSNSRGAGQTFRSGCPHRLTSAV